MENNEITLVFTSIQDMWAYVFTKALPKLKHFICFTSLGLFSPHSLVIRGGGDIWLYLSSTFKLSNFGHILNIWMNGENWENAIQVEWLSSNRLIITSWGYTSRGMTLNPKKHNLWPNMYGHLQHFKLIQNIISSLTWNVRFQWWSLSIV